MTECFISYAHAPADEIALGHLKTVLKDARVSFWSDDCANHQDGLELNQEIADAISDSKIVLMMVSSQSLSSPYCRSELAFALQQDKAIIRIDVEPVEIPGALLPLASSSSLSWTPERPSDFARKLLGALLVSGVLPFDIDEEILFKPEAAVIRPSYGTLHTKGPASWAEYVRRLNEAKRIAPSNGYNHLSLSLVWIAHRDAQRALECAQHAVSLLPREPDAHYAEALARCIQRPPTKRSQSEVDAVLRRLAIARRLPGAGAHIDLLTALVISNFHLLRYLTPPVAPEEILRRGLERERFDPDENARALDTEPAVDTAYLTSIDLIARYRLPNP